MAESEVLYIKLKVKGEEQVAGRNRKGAMPVADWVDQPCPAQLQAGQNPALLRLAGASDGKAASG